jgi:peptidoglycan lytic transglycosylase D
MEASLTQPIKHAAALALLGLLVATAPCAGGAFGPDMPGWAASGGSKGSDRDDSQEHGSAVSAKPSGQRPEAPNAEPAPPAPGAPTTSANAASAMEPSSDPDGDDAGVAPPRLAGIKAERNERVDKWIDFFTGRGREDFQRWLSRSGSYMELLTRNLHAEGMPEELANLVFVESGFNMHARSVARAVGPWQFIRGTAKLFGLKMTPYVDERRDPERATRAAARYLRRLYSMFDGSWPLALAAFNSGEGTVQRAIRKQGTSDYWSLRLPRETEDYVPQFLAAMEIASDPERYGFEAPPNSPFRFDEVVVKGPVDLKLIAQITSTPLEELKNLNPMLVRHRLPAIEKDGTVLRVPQGRGDEIQDTLAASYHPKPLSKAEVRAATYAHRLDVKRSLSRRGHGGRIYVVQRGDTLSEIGKRYGKSPTALARINGLKSARELRAGMRIRIR